MATVTDTDIVTRLAREAGAYFANDDCDDCREVTFTDAEDLARFAALLVEECAKACDERWQEDCRSIDSLTGLGARMCAEAIRAKFKEPT